MALSEIGKRIKKQEVKTTKNPNNVVFGIPQNQQTPDLKGTMATAETTPTGAKPVSLKSPEPEPVKPTTEQVRQFDADRGVSISQGETGDRATPPGRSIPLIGPILFGRGSNKVYGKDTVAGMVEKEGVVGFVFEGWTKFTNPTQAQLGERIYESYDKFAQGGIPEERALDAAIQNVVNQTYGGAINIEDFKNRPEIELTEEEKDLVFWINARDDAFAILDAPIFVGSTKIATEGAQELVERIAPVRDNVIKRLETQVTAERGGKRVPDVLGSDEVNAEIQTYLENLKKNPEPSINELNRGLELMRTSGREYEDIAQDLVSVTKEVAENPAKYIQDPKTGQFRGSRAADLKPFVDEGEVTAVSIQNLEGRGKVSKQFIEDGLKQPNVKQAEREIVQGVLNEYEVGAKINAQEFAEKVRAQLLPLEEVQIRGEWRKYESVSLPPELRGDVAEYGEVIYRSPISNSAGEVHFSSLPPGVRDGYFLHSRFEDMADGITRREIELQSDLFQKGRLEGQVKQGMADGTRKLKEITDDASAGISQLQPYRNTFWERGIRERVKKAAQDGKSVLQFPTGETAMKIEGLGENRNFYLVEGGFPTQPLKPELLKAGEEFSTAADDLGEKWVITEVLDDGKFKAASKSRIANSTDDVEQFISDISKPEDFEKRLRQKNKIEGEDEWLSQRLADRKRFLDNISEQFDISGKVDETNPIYKFYEKDVQKYLTKKYGAKVVTDENGVSWVQMAVNKEAAERPVEAFAGGAIGLEEDENGDLQIDPMKAFLGMGAAAFLGVNFNKFRGRNRNRSTAAQGGTPDRPQPQALPKKTSPKGGTGVTNLASSDLSQSLTKAYADMGGESIVDIERAINPHTLKPRKASPEDMSRFSKLREGIDNKWTDAMQWFQDDMVKVRNLVENPYVKVEDETNPYLAELLFHGRVGNRIAAARDKFIKIDQEIVTTAKTNGVPDQDMTVLVNEYLHARHAPERNLKLGDGAAGITNAEATETLAKINALPYSKDVARIADQVQAMNNETLDILLEAKVIDKESYDAMRTAYKNHVPLQRVLSEDEDIMQVLSGKGFDVKATGIKRAKGSKREVADIMTNVVTNYEQSLIRAEKNMVDLVTLNFARNNKELGLFEELTPKAIGRMFGEGGEATGAIIKEAITDPRVLTLRENGKPVFLLIKNEDLAMSLRGVSRQQIPSWLNGVRAFTSFYSGLQTRFNPEFAFPNKIRDLQEATIYAGSRGELGFSGGIKGALDQKAYKDVLDNIRGVDSEGARLYQQMIDDGGTTGGMSLSTRQAVTLDIEEIRKLNRSNPRAAADKFIRTIDDFNTIFEDSTRLALYKQALKRGVSRKRAAMLAKESSINFNKFGRGGKIVNALWMFSNASIQGTTKMMRAMKDPKVAAVVGSSVYAGVYATGEWNDTVDPNWREKVTEWDRINSLVLVLPSENDDEFDYVTIPVGWGIKPIKVGADYMYDASVGKGATSEEAFSAVVSAAINAYNPVGGTDTLSGITPTIADIPSEIYRNQAWHGGKIMPDWDERKDHLRYFSSLTDNTTGRTAVEISSGLTHVGIEVSPASLYYAYQGYVGGAGRTATDAVNTMISLGRGEMPDPNDIPVWSRFVKNRDNEEIGNGSEEYERIKQLQIEEDSERAILNFDAEDALKRLQSMEEEEAATLFDELAKKDPDLAAKITDLIDAQKLGLTSTQRNLKGLTVETRANYIYDKLESLESDEERAELWDEYTEKKIITDSVAEEINNIRNGTAGQEARPNYKNGETTTQRSFIENISLYAEAIKTDPVTAFNRLFTGQKIRRIDGGAIIVERMPFADSREVREKWGATEELRLDHTLPLQLGGSNSEDNLKLVPIEDWERYTTVENMLGRALRDGKIEAKLAEQLILDYKAGKVTSQQIKDSIESE